MDFNSATGLSRREMFLAGTGLIAVPTILSAQTAAPGSQPAPRTPTAAPPPSPRSANPAAPLQDPRKLYPAPPFEQQRQEAPGLASKMVPRPDHGEDSYRGSGKLAGRRALITGGDSGIGRGAAIAFAREGADVAIGYLPAEQPDADEVVDLIRSEGRKAITLPGDIRDEQFCRQMITRAVEQLGGLDVLVLNAGQQVFQQSISDITTAQMESIFRTNVFANMWLVQAALPHLKPGSSIIVTASIQAFDPTPNILDYAMTKACNVNFVKGLAKVLTPQGIRVNGVAPGPIWTPLQPSGGQSPEKLVEFGKDSPFGRPGQPAELAATFVLLASSDSSYVSGEVHGVTGGNPTP